MIVSGPAFIWRRSASQSAVRSFDEAFALVRSDLSLQAESNESLKESVERDEKRRQIEKQIVTLQSKIRKEKQLNKQMRLNAELKKLKKYIQNM